MTGLAARPSRPAPSPPIVTAEADDAALVDGARAGDRAAFDELVRRHANRLHAVVIRVIGDANEAEDVTQEVLLRAWRGIDGFDGRARFSTWLLRIGINEATRLARRRAVSDRSLSNHELGEVGDSRTSPERVAGQNDLRRALERAIAALAPEYRAPLVLRDIAGLSTSEAATAMGLREGAFKSRLHRARLSVREAMDAHLDEGRDR